MVQDPSETMTSEEGFQSPDSALFKRLGELRDSEIEPSLKDELDKLDVLLVYFSNAIQVLLNEHERNKLLYGNAQDHLLYSNAWHIVKLWRLFLILQRYTTLSTALISIGKRLRGTNPQGLSLDEIYALDELNERELIRFLFLHCDAFRVLLSVIEWCECIGRIEVKMKEKNNCDLGLGSLRYAETCFRLEMDLNQGLTDVLPKCYHLDLVSTLAAPNGTAFQSQRSRRKIPNSAMISPHDLDEASLFYRRVWMFLTAGQIETLKAYLDRVGEPWLGSLVDGQEPPSDSDCLATEIYDSILLSLPDDVSKLVDCEARIENESSTVLFGCSKDSRKRDGSYQLEDQLNESRRIMDDPIMKDLYWEDRTYISRILFDLTGVVLKDKQRAINQAELYPEGNQWRRLMMTVAQSALDDGHSSNIYEKAFYGYLCGRSSSMFNVCETWREFVWSNCIELRERIICQFIERRREWKTLLSEWNSLSTAKVLEGIFHSGGLRYSSVDTNENMVRAIISKYLLAQFNPDFFMDIATFLIQLEYGSKEIVKDENLDPIHKGERIKPSFHVSGFIRDFGAIMKSCCIGRFTAERQKEDWTKLCDQLMLSSLSNRPPYETPDSIKTAIFLLSKISPYLRVDASSAWLLSFVNVTESDHSEFLEFAIHKLIEISHETFPLILLRVTCIVWDQLTLHSPPTQSTTFLSSPQYSLLHLALSILSHSPMYIEWAQEERGSLHEVLKTSANIICSWMVRGEGISENLRTVSEDALLILERSRDDVNHDDDDTLACLKSDSINNDHEMKEYLNHIDIFTFLIALASPLMSLLARSSISEISVGKYRGELMKRRPSDGSTTQSRKGNRRTVDGRPTLKTIGTLPPSFYTGLEEDIDQENQEAFLVDLVSDALLNPCLQLIDELLTIRFKKSDSIVNENIDIQYEGITNGLKKNKKINIRDILMKFSKTVPSILQNSVRSRKQHDLNQQLERTSKCQKNSDWDCVDIDERISLCLTPIIHYLSVQQFFNVLWEMTDYRTLLIDSIYKMAARHHPDLHELTSLTSTLSTAFQCGFPWTPYLPQNTVINSPIINEYNILPSLGVTLGISGRQISSIETEFLHLLVMLIVDIFSCFVEAAQALPSDNRVPSLWQSIKESTMNVFMSSYNQCQQLKFPTQILCLMESLLVDIKSVFKS